MTHVVDIDRVSHDLDVIPLFPIEVQDHVVAKPLDPVIVHLIVFAGDAAPVDGSIVFDVTQDDVPLAINQYQGLVGPQSAQKSARSVLDRLRKAAKPDLADHALAETLRAE